MSFRLAVLSDLHVDRRADAASWELGKATFDAAAGEEPDHTIIAGDLFDCSSAMQRDRDRVEKRLRRLGLWDRDRLSIVVGNHDIFHTPHRGSKWHRAKEFLRVGTQDANERYNEFIAWAGELVPKAARYWSNDLFPFCKDLGLVGLLAADTTSKKTDRSANGYWRKRDDAAARALATGERRILAIHHPPEPNAERTLVEQLAEGFPFGFPHRHFARLEEFADGVSLDAVVCGHIHVGGQRSWRLGRRTRVFRAGETGGVHGAKPSFLVLEVPRRGPVRCRRVRV